MFLLDGKKPNNNYSAETCIPCWYFDDDICWCFRIIGGQFRCISDPRSFYNFSLVASDSSGLMVFYSHPPKKVSLACNTFVKQWRSYQVSNLHVWLPLTIFIFKHRCLYSLCTLSFSSVMLVILNYQNPHVEYNYVDKKF